jgi:3-methyladenine DNA glycosylase AlkD
MPPTAASIRRQLRAVADPSRVPILQRFFRTGKGEYAEGDRFIGVTVPQMRAICRECRDTSLSESARLLHSPIHEERLTALLLIVDAFTRGDDERKREIYDFYLANTYRVNNWDLVDSSAPQIVGAWLRDRSKAPLTRLARSAMLWERRIAIVATQDFIRQRRLDETFRIADLLIEDPHDLIHKATGWMLREAGKRDEAALRGYLDRRHTRMPRTMLRYAIERLPERERLVYLGRHTPRGNPADAPGRPRRLRHGAGAGAAK